MVSEDHYLVGLVGQAGEVNAPFQSITRNHHFIKTNRVFIQDGIISRFGILESPATESDVLPTLFPIILHI